MFLFSFPLTDRNGNRLRRGRLRDPKRDSGAVESAGMAESRQQCAGGIGAHGESECAFVVVGGGGGVLSCGGGGGFAGMRGWDGMHG
jgi:hypothetical protein